MADVTRRLARFIANLTLDKVPDEVRHQARRFVLDTLGCAIAGARSDLGPMIARAAGLFGEGEATVAGHGRRFSPAAASYANGRLANCLDLDDTYPGGPVPGVHFGASVFGAALTVCEQQSLGLDDLLLAIICGYETAGRVCDVGTQIEIVDGRAGAMPRVWGLSLAPTVGAAAAAGRLVSKDAETFEQILGLSASNASNPTGPLWSRQLALPNTNCFDSGWSAMAGWFSAHAVIAGTTALPDILDGDVSIFTMVGINRVDPEAVVHGLGFQWALCDTVYKPWPSCRFHHQPISALKRLREQHHFQINDIQEIMIGVNADKLPGRFLNSHPQTFIAKEFSFPHSIAMFLMDIPPGADWGSSRWDNDPVVCSLRAKVKFCQYPEAATAPQFYVRGQFRQMPCFVEIRFESRTLRAEAEFAWGDPWSDETRFSDADIVAKFRSVTRLPTAVADAVIETVMVSDLGANLAPVFAAMSDGFADRCSL